MECKNVEEYWYDSIIDLSDLKRETEIEILLLFLVNWFSMLFENRSIQYILDRGTYRHIEECCYVGVYLISI